MFMARILVAAMMLLVTAPAQAQTVLELPSEAPVPQPSPRAKLSPDCTGEGDRQTNRQGDKQQQVKQPASPSEPLEPGATRNGVAAQIAPEPRPDFICERALDRMGVKYKRNSPVTGSSGCGVALPYNVIEPAPGVALRPQTQITCETALTLARWVQRVVIPASTALGPHVRLREIGHASTYVCRNRNNDPEADLSVHARGEAIDISSFGFHEHEPIPIAPRKGEGTMTESFQKAVRAGACLYFSTVLGPGSDAYHNDHLHLDIKKRERGFRLCQ